MMGKWYDKLCQIEWWKEFFTELNLLSHANCKVDKKDDNISDGDDDNINDGLITRLLRRRTTKRREERSSSCTVRLLIFRRLSNEDNNEVSIMNKKRA